MNNLLLIAFGSQVSGMNNQLSDFDFGALFLNYKGRSLTLDDRLKVIEFISEKFKINEDKIDLIDINSAPPLLRFEIAKKGKLVYGTNYDYFRFRVRAFKEYNDTTKFRRLKEKLIMKDYVS